MFTVGLNVSNQQCSYVKPSDSLLMWQVRNLDKFVDLLILELRHAVELTCPW